MHRPWIVAFPHGVHTHSSLHRYAPSPDCRPITCSHGVFCVQRCRSFCRRVQRVRRPLLFRHAAETARRRGHLRLAHAAYSAMRNTVSAAGS